MAHYLLSIGQFDIDRFLFGLKEVGVGELAVLVCWIHMLEVKALRQVC